MARRLELLMKIHDCMFACMGRNGIRLVDLGRCLLNMYV